MRMQSLLICLCIFLGCKDKNRSWVQLQPALKFSLSDSNTLFRLYSKDSIKFGYYADNFIFWDSSGIRTEKKYVIIGINSQNNDTRYYISVGNVAENSSIQNIKMYYINWPNGESDTLFADYKRDHGDNNKNSCKCIDPLIELKLNGKPFIRKTNYDINGIYIFDR